MRLPRIMLAAPASGSGKTLVTCGILQALVNRGLRVASFKCGPDYIDPMFHSRVIGARSGNLDTFFTDGETTRYLFGRAASEADISVIEGVMGYFDGLGGISEQASSSDVARTLDAPVVLDVARTLDAPVVLVVNCRGMSLSVLALIQGFVEYRKPGQIRGVILNQLPASLYPDLKERIEEDLPVRVLGYVPKAEELVLESRHLGLVLPGEIERLREKLQKLAALLEETLDLEGLISMAREAPELLYREPELPRAQAQLPGHGKISEREKIRIGVAQDEAFCFTYRDNLQLLQDLGAELVPFSPLADAGLPENLQGLILSGGYPELHAARLAENASMREGLPGASRGPAGGECFHAGGRAGGCTGRPSLHRGVRRLPLSSPDAGGGGREGLPHGGGTLCPGLPDAQAFPVRLYYPDGEGGSASSGKRGGDPGP